MTKEEGPLVPSDVAPLLCTRVLGRRLFFYPETASTNDAAVALARGGEGEGAVVYADFQTRGRGRLDHVWLSPRRRDLLFSMIFRPGGEPADALPVTLAVALALSVVLTGATGERVAVKWPNDLLVGERKIAGILAESGTDVHGARFVVVGVGVNVNSTPSDFPDDVRARVVSCCDLTGTRHDRALLLADALAAVETYTTRFGKDGFAPLASSYEERLSLLGARVRVARAGDVIEGVVAGVRADGALRVTRDDGGEVALFSETVEVIA